MRLNEVLAAKKIKMTSKTSMRGIRLMSGSSCQGLRLKFMAPQLQMGGFVRFHLPVPDSGYRPGVPSGADRTQRVSGSTDERSRREWQSEFRNPCCTAPPKFRVPVGPGRHLRE